MNYEEVPGTWAFELKEHWEVFCKVCDLMNEKGNEGKVDRLKWREYILWDMQRRHNLEIGNDSNYICTYCGEKNES